MSCWPWSHKWTKWELFAEGKMLKTFNALTGNPLNVDGKPAIIGRYIEQRRECTECGKLQMRREKL